jgi:hypothetical protein
MNYCADKHTKEQRQQTLKMQNNKKPEAETATNTNWLEVFKNKIAQSVKKNQEISAEMPLAEQEKKASNEKSSLDLSLNGKSSNAAIELDSSRKEGSPSRDRSDKENYITLQ